MKRLFIAIDCSDNKDVILIHRRLKMMLKNDKMSWTKPENHHLTLKFLGSTPSESIADIQKVLENICEHTDKISLEFSRLGIFGSSYKPRVIWLGFENNPIITALAEEIKTEFIPLGFKADRQNFVPHLTLARVQKIQSKAFFQSVLDSNQPQKTESLQVNEILLLESKLQKEGPEYHIIKRFQLH